MSLLEVRLFREELVRRWERQMASLGALSLASTSERPEEVAFQFVDKLAFGLSWHQETWVSCQKESHHIGLNWEYLKNKVALKATPLGEVLLLETPYSITWAK